MALPRMGFDVSFVLIRNLVARLLGCIWIRIEGVLRDGRRPFRWPGSAQGVSFRRCQLDPLTKAGEGFSAHDSGTAAKGKG